MLRRVHQLQPQLCLAQQQSVKPPQPQRLHQHHQLQRGRRRQDIDEAIVDKNHFMK